MNTRIVPRLALLFVLACNAWPAAAQRLPIDPQVTVKKLPNGLTYYIRANKKPENRAQFHLVVNAGSMQETEKQRGLAHFLEHMAFNGTKNFKKHELIDFLETTGMRFGADLNAYTSFDETAYRLEIPMDKPEVLAKAFQVLEDWAHQISFEPEEIEKERGVVIEEWRTGRGARGRLMDKQIPVLFHDSRYAVRLPIGTTNCIQSVDRAEFLDFHRKWYRPDLMAVIAVGDFDPAQIESLIQRHFGKLENPPQAPPRTVAPVPDHPDTLFSIETDPELSSTSIEIACKHPVQPDGTAADYRRDMVNSLYSIMLNQRLAERVQEANPPYLGAGVGKIRMVRAKELAVQQARVKDGLYAEGLKALLLESKRAGRDGFTPAEFERAKASMLRSLESAYEERDKTESSDYVREYVGNFLEDEPIPGIAVELKLARGFLGEISLGEVNRAADHWITETNRVILFSAPAKADAPPPSRDQILAVIRASDAAPIAAYQDDVSDEPLVPKKPAPGSIAAESRHPAVDTLEWKLSNGAVVLLKPTAFKNDEILMNAHSPGGLSLIEDKDYLSGSMSASIVRQSGVGAYDSIQLRKKLAGKIAFVGSSIRDQAEELQGSASPKDLETWFQLMHLYFTAPRADEQHFQSFVTRLKVSIENRLRDPQAVFGDAIEKALYGNHPRHLPLTLERLTDLDRETALRVYHERFANAGDFTFTFVGAFQPDELRPLVETYLASLPGTDRKEAVRHVGDDRKAGRLSVEVKKGIEPKSSVRIQFHGAAAWSNEERYALRGTIDVLRIRLREILREDKGGVYGVGVYGDLSRVPKQTFSCAITFGCSPDTVDDLIKAALDEIERLKKDGPSAEDTEKVRATNLRNFERGLKENAFWLANLDFYRENEMPFEEILTLPDRANALTAEKIRAAARKYFSGENVLTARLFPEAAPAADAKPAK